MKVIYAPFIPFFRNNYEMRDLHTNFAFDLNKGVLTYYLQRFPNKNCLLRVIRVIIIQNLIQNNNEAT